MGELVKNFGDVALWNVFGSWDVLGIYLLVSTEKYVMFMPFLWLKIKNHMNTSRALATSTLWIPLVTKQKTSSGKLPLMIDLTAFHELCYMTRCFSLVWNHAFI